MSPRAEALAPNLWRWTTAHPLWRPGDDERAGGWERTSAPSSMRATGP